MPDRVRLNSGTLGRPRPPAHDYAARFRHGATFLIDAIALMARDPKLLRRALVPALVFLGILALVAKAELEPSAEDPSPSYWRSFYVVIIASAGVSPIVFTKSYARLAAHARLSAGFDPVDPFLRGYGEAAWEAVLQLFGLGLYLAPILGLLERFPVVGVAVGAVLTFAWASHWSTVEALDAARPAPEQAAEEAKGAAQRRPWFARQPEDDGPLASLRPLTFLPTLWGRMVCGTFRRWFGEIAFMEARPATSLGFTVAVALVLLVPVLNLFARPLTVMAASLWMAHEELADANEATRHDPLGASAHPDAATPALSPAAPDARPPA